MRFTRQDAATFLTDNGNPIAPATLAKKAVEGSGPPFCLFNGRALYDREDLLEWAAKMTSAKAASTALHERAR